MVALYLRHVAEDVRRILAGLGLRSLDDAIGRADLLRPRSESSLDVGALLGPVDGERRFLGHLGFQRPRSALGDRLADRAWRAIRDGDAIELDLAITNRDRAVGARLGGLIGRAFGVSTPPGRATVRLRGDAGQSFGAFLAAGVELRLVGAANDGVGKGMSGGRIAIAPPEDDAGDPCLVGNTALYGATGGELLVAGTAGERFAVRNSGAAAVVEGAGDHCCEYMTGGVVVVLGPVGWNLGAGMTGGEAFVFDPDTRAPARVNPQLVDLVRPDLQAAGRLRTLLERHADTTGSPRAAEVLRSWSSAAHRFWRVVPRTDVADVAMRQEGTIRRAAVAASPA
jgi:glutamate synthase (ferredoxin)